MRLRLLTVLAATLVSTSAFADGVPGQHAAPDPRVAALEKQIGELKALLAEAVSRTASVEKSSLEERIDALDQQVRVLARQLELERKAAAEAAKQLPAVRAGREGFVLRSADNAFLLRFRGYLQSDARVYVDDDGLAADAFLMRRVRPIVEATVFRQFDFRVMPDFGGGTTVLQDAYLDARFHHLFRVRAGKYKSPFGLERLMSATDLPFIERALPTALVPNRDVGVSVHGDWRTGTLTYMGGVFNGVPDGASTDGDDQDGKDVLARVFAQPFKSSRRPALQGLGVGVAGSYGLQRGRPGAPNLPQYRSAGQLTFFRFRADGTEAGTAVADGTHYRVSGQGHYYAGRAGVIVEQVFSAQQLRREAATAQVRSNAWQTSASYVLTGEKATARGVTPVKSFDGAAGNWGAFEVVARYSALSVSGEAFPLFANPAVSARAAQAWGAGLNWYLNPAVKFSIDYEQTTFDGGAPGGNRPAERDLFTRFQFTF